LNKEPKDWDYDERDYLRLMKAYVENRIDVDTYRTSFFAMSSKRSLVADNASVIIQKAYGDADDYDPVVRLAYTIEEPALKERVAKSIVELETLGYRVEDSARDKST
jgi:hypothetical protein